MSTSEEILSTAIEHHRSGRLQIAEQLYQQILQSDRNQADAIHLLGVIAHQCGDHAASVTHILRAIQINGETADACCNLGIAYHALQKFPEALACYRRALELKDDDVETHINLGVVLKSLGRPHDALASYRRAAELNPNCVEALNNIGIEFKELRQFDEAINTFRRALELRPEFVEVHNNLGNAFKEQGNLDEAVACYRRAIDLKPDYFEAHNNLGNPYKDQGKLDESLACFRRALALRPSDAVAHSNLVYTQLFSFDYDGPALLTELRQWNATHAVALANSIEPHVNDRSPNRRLKIGYVSPDFRDHCQSFFTVPLFASHDRANFGLYCYSDVTRPDQLTDRLRSSVDHWRDTAGLDHAQLAQAIRHDQIDILVDLSMHMAQNRLLVFARKPAPVQVCWLAYPGSTGVSTIDFRITDPYLDPPSLGDDCYSEKSMRLPETFWCYDPLDIEPAVNGVPFFEAGTITFGCLNNFCKVNATVLKMWARVLLEVKGSRMVILAGEGTHRQQTIEQLETEGVDRDRVTFVSPRPRPQYLRYYHQIDIGLDTVPYNGHTTSLDSFWMGVPVVTLVGSTVVGRAGYCQLMNLKLPELIAETPEQYVRIAAELASDRARLSELRAGLRNRIRASPLMDAKRFARNLEAAYREMWKRYCQDENQR